MRYCTLLLLILSLTSYALEDTRSGINGITLNLE